MRKKYFQGTLDFFCGIYAVINALASTRKIDLSTGRRILQETLQNISIHPNLWEAFLHNNTDHYWVVKYMLSYWCSKQQFYFDVKQPFSSCLLPNKEAADLGLASLHLPEEELTDKYGIQIIDPKKISYSWDVMENWLSNNQKGNRVVIFRFHRFFPNHSQPLVSHWTVASSIKNSTIFLNDASPDEGSLNEIESYMVLPDRGAPHIRIPLESIVLLENSTYKPTST